MAKNKGSRITITLEYKDDNVKNSKNINRKSGVFRYTTTKNRRNTPARLELRKFCPYRNKHVNFKEIK